MHIKYGKQNLRCACETHENWWGLFLCVIYVQNMNKRLVGMFFQIFFLGGGGGGWTVPLTFFFFQGTALVASSYDYLVWKPLMSLVVPAVLGWTLL